MKARGLCRAAAAATWTARVVLVLALLPGVASAATQTDPRSDDRPDSTVPEEVRKGIEEALKEKVSALLEEKNAEGASYKRGAYSKNYREVGGEIYTVTFHVNTAEEATLVTERFLLTLERDPSDPEKWVIVSEDLKDVYRGLSRPTFEDVGFHRFDTFAFEKEGLKVRASNGSFYTLSRKGKVESFTVAAADLAFEYEPPGKRDRMLYERLKRKHAAEILFDPDVLQVSCDPSTCEDLLAAAFSGTEPVGIDRTDEALRNRYDAVSEDYKKNLDRSYFYGFWPEYEPDHRRWQMEFRHKRLGNDRRIRVTHDSLEAKEVDYSVYGLYKSYPFWQTVYTYHSEDTRSAEISPLELERRDDQSRRDYDLESIRGTIEMALADSETLIGTLTYGLTTKRTLRYVPFYVARLSPERADQKEAMRPTIFVNSIQDGQGNDLTFVKLGGSFGLIVFPEPLPAGTKLELQTDFENKGAIRKLTPSYSYLSRGGWLPFVRFGDMIHDFDLTVKVPERYTTLGIGHMVEEKVENGVRSTRWVPDFPVEFPTVIYGTYVEAESDVKAFKSDGTPIPVNIYVDTTSMGVYGITPKSLKAFADEAANAVNLYREIFGVDYPYNKLDLVNDPAPALYGQAPSSIVYLGSMGFRSKGALGTMDTGRGDMNLPRFTKSLVAHEVGHQWWGSLIANANFRNYWFVESLAEYSSALFVENVFGVDDYLEHVESWRRRVLDTDMHVSVQEATEMWGGDFGAYQAAVYSKGPYAFHVMRSTWGDRKFFAFLKMLAQDLKGQEIVTRDIQRVAEKAFGGNMEWFFDQWFRGVGMPEYSFTHSWRQTEDGKYLVEGRVEQRVLVGRDKDPLKDEYFLAVIPITVIGKSGKEYRFPLRVEGPETRFRFKISEEPDEVLFNKYGEVLAHDIIARK
jgi:hypothetical protein